MAKRWIVVAGVAACAVSLAALVVLREQAEHQAQERSHTVAQAVERVAKLATVEMNISNWQLRKDSKQLFGFLPFRCEKTVAVFYRGKVAAGFDLHPKGADRWRVVFNAAEKVVDIALPAPRILYNDVPAPELIVSDGSVCNSLTSEDYTRLHNDARAAVEREAVASGVLLQAESHARDLLTEVVRALGYTLKCKMMPAAKA